MSLNDGILGAAHEAPTLDPSACVDAVSDVGPMFLHRDDEFITPTILTTGSWEPSEGAFLRSVLAPGARFLDVGANIGYFTLLGSQQVGPQGSVLAVEPEPRNLQLLRANLWRNAAWNAGVLPVAAQAYTGYAGLRLPATSNGDHRTFAADAQSGLLVPALRLDDLLAGEALDVVKIDAQGADHEVIAGLRDSVAGSPQIVIMCEFWLPEMEELAVDPFAVLAEYEAMGLQLGLLAPDGTAEVTSAATAVEACRVADGSFINLVLARDVSVLAQGAFGAASASAGGADRDVSDLPREHLEQPPTASLRDGAHVDAAVAEKVSALVDSANRAGGGYHVMRPLAGVRLDGVFDLTTVLGAYHLPEDLTGQAVLDVGTASGLFAVECARRGAHVTALDVVRWDEESWAITELLGDDVSWVKRDIYELDASFGQFDLVICGSLLLHLPDPFGALTRLRGVCRGRAIVATACPDEDSDGAVCEFVAQQVEVDGGGYWSYWSIGGEALRRMLLAAGFARVECQEHFILEPVSAARSGERTHHAVAHGVV